MGKTFSKNEAMDPKLLTPGGGGKPLYDSCEWDLRVVKKLITEKKLAPFFPGSADVDDRYGECPICFLNYPLLNKARCCKQPICTACFLQVKTPSKSSDAQCPFCMQGGFFVVFTGPKTQEEVDSERVEQQKVLELQLKIRQDEIKRDAARANERAKKKEKKKKEEEGSRSCPSPRGEAGSSRRASSKRKKRARHAPDHQQQQRSEPISMGTGSPPSPPSNYVRSAPAASAAPINAQRPLHRTTAAARPPAALSEREAALQSVQDARRSGMSEANLEEIMLMTAIRLSLLDNPEEAAVAPGDSSQEDRTETLSGVIAGLTEPPEGLIDTPEGLTEPPEGLIDTPEGLTEPPEGLIDPPEDLTDPPEGLIDLTVPPEGLMDTPEGLIGTPEGLVDTPEGLVDTPEGLVEEDEDPCTSPTVATPSSEQDSEDAFPPMSRPQVGVFGTSDDGASSQDPEEADEAAAVAGTPRARPDLPMSEEEQLALAISLSLAEM